MTAGAINRILVEILELDLDRCLNVYGHSPCTGNRAAGLECYNTRVTCQVAGAYLRGTHTYRFCGRGAPLPINVPVQRPYIESISTAATTIDPQVGFAPRSSTTIILMDETDADVEQDPYITTRASAGGTFWTRLLARNKNYSGRFARVKRGLFTPGADGNVSYTTDDAAFSTELYIIENIDGPDVDGKITITLKDPSKLADRTQIPAPTDGTLAADFLATANSGTAQAGGASTITLAASASAVDNTYNTYAITITGGAGSGQERVISSYVGATRVATVSVAWAVQPNNTSTYTVQALSITLATGKGAQYHDPAVTGNQEYFCTGDEIVRYTAISGDTLSWPNTSYREQFGTSAKDCRSGEKVQQCAVWINKAWTAVLTDILQTAGLPASYIDSAGMAVEEATWLGTKYNVTACIAQPEQASKLLKELAQQAMGVLWWAAVEQLIKFKILLPAVSAAPSLFTDDANVIDKSVSVSPLDDERITFSALYYNQLNAAKFKSEPSNYGVAILNIDADAEGPDEYGDRRMESTYSRWMTSPANDLAAAAWVARRVAYFRDAPKLVTIQLDPKDGAFNPGDLRQLQTRQIAAADGSPLMQVMLITKRVDKGTHIEAEMRTTTFARRYAFIAPTGYPDYTTATDAQKQYAFIANNTDKMSNGDNPYLII